MIHRRQGAEQTCELQARLEKLCKRARKAGTEWLKGELKKEVRTLKRMVANEGRDGLQRALRGVKWEQLRPLMLQAGMGSEHVVSTLSLAELQSRFVESTGRQDIHNDCLQAASRYTMIKSLQKIFGKCKFCFCLSREIVRAVSYTHLTLPTKRIV